MSDEDLNSIFKPGTEVEISSNEEGFRGAWYTGTVVKSKNRNKLIQVEYKTLMADESGRKPLRETLNVVQLRPLAPREKGELEFKFSDEVDAYYNDGWWEGVITGVLPGNRYDVFFRATREQLEFSASQLRIHREWFYGNWLPPLQQQDQDQAYISTGLNISNNDKFIKGATVEVCSDEEGYYGAWFTATIVEQLSNGNFKIEYKSLRNDDDTALLTEIVDSNHIRPCPPTETIEHFRMFEEVDALCNDGWWVGVVSKVLSRQKYEVFFRGTDEELVVKQSDLRRHLEWINGKWISSSSVCNLIHR
ncbi:putative Agenet-like domain-containing protein [Helianthus annuus]|uniref:Agenet-like domain-containing protein n=1 Tax=Helianthus annuus TaxID=4232 RepID=A0A251ULT0_HELAN|nr:protein AGENET DOMAIN (AGD)-CONTAINING P1 [Helianthus annuus]KAF5797915.1 putative Agenet-like domain-containing protein [Helianthus annuus]KAJ0549586.1 putative Agenet-like domain-containing protein [Helianthus annuus]KAJ0556022.1 putative Agenet-like domain-containing protein [Helianthus annuus]KAJ0562542.1 putative Agenet-like domain-containing protein [Helianthus annuus]KAJ0727917.1 putative Agenet-like domain-containing protein [Helianthus annuus]